MVEPSLEKLDKLIQDLERHMKAMKEAFNADRLDAYDKADEVLLHYDRFAHDLLTLHTDVHLGRTSPTAQLVWDKAHEMHNDAKKMLWTSIGFTIEKKRASA